MLHAVCDQAQVDAALLQFSSGGVAKVIKKLLSVGLPDVLRGRLPGFLDFLNA